MLQQALSEFRNKIALKSRYDNFIGGQWVAPVGGQYFDNPSPITGERLCEIARSTAADIDLALDAAHAAKDAWGRTAPAERARVLNKIADRMEDALGLLALVETIDNGKPIRETTAADLPLAVDHFRYFAGCIRAQEGGIGEVDDNTVAYHFHEPLGVVGQIIPWNFPLLMAAWKLAAASDTSAAFRSHATIRRLPAPTRSVPAPEARSMGRKPKHVAASRTVAGAASATRSATRR